MDDTCPQSSPPPSPVYSPPPPPAAGTTCITVSPSKFFSCEYSSVEGRAPWWSAQGYIAKQLLDHRIAPLVCSLCTHMQLPPCHPRPALQAAWTSLRPPSLTTPAIPWTAPAPCGPPSPSRTAAPTRRSRACLTTPAPCPTSAARCPRTSRPPAALPSRPNLSGMTLARCPGATAPLWHLATCSSVAHRSWRRVSGIQRALSPVAIAPPRAHRSSPTAGRLCVVVWVGWVAFYPTCPLSVLVKHHPAS